MPIPYCLFPLITTINHNGASTQLRLGEHCIRQIHLLTIYSRLPIPDSRFPIPDSPF
ncbi:hypothetical protein BJP36_42180 [Moorena producens JHB]|uniref:Uncharacterized protein n=1 Tax=Moorena producens (strain JHB) TaxID=1454205 RepID=A0A9Q9SSS2_MOOP1|nr:hypothetical protein [Moorena producens]WAN68970.1 hypothetical protein BJP36_42180 [Moorena producens JHB]